MSLQYRRFWIAIGWALVGAVIYLSVGHVTITPENIPESDKVGHVIAYGTLMFWFMQIAKQPQKRVAIAVLLVLLGVGLEFVQAHIPYRDFEVADMVADAIGVAIGWLVAPPRTPNVLSALEKALLRPRQADS